MDVLQSKTFFSLPEEEKAECRIGDDVSGHRTDHNFPDIESSYPVEYGVGRNAWGDPGSRKSKG